MDFSLTKEQLEEKLLALDATRSDFEPRGMFAMCYAPMPRPRPRPEKDTVSKVCEQCGKQFSIVGRGVRKVLTNYRRIAKECRDFGYDAQILFYCDRCVSSHSLPILEHESTNVFFGFKTKEEKEYHLTPLDQMHCDDGDLRIALEFLKGAKSYQELDKDYGAHSLYGSADGFRESIERVLGLGAQR